MGVKMNKIATELEGVKTVAIAGHIRPDGDCIGSCMGMYHYIRENYPDIQADVYLEEIPLVFSYISDVEKINHTYDNDSIYDLFISLDCADRERLGKAAKYLESARKTICIDHHISNLGFADIDYIHPDVSSTSELIYDLIEEENLTKPIAEALYTGIVHDTGVFQYPSTSGKTMTIAGKLMGTGIEFTKIIEESFYKKTFVQNQILGRVLLESMLLLDGKCIVSVLSKKDMDFYNVTSKDLEGIVSQLKVTEGVEVAMFLYEVDIMQYKISLRSKGKVNVNEVASYFNGGGHVLASGCSFSGTYRDAISNVMKQIEKQLVDELL